MGTTSTRLQTGWESLGGRYHRLDPDGHLVQVEDFLSAASSDRLLRDMRRSLDWEQRPIRLFGRQILQPRLTAFHGDADVAYRYSGQTLEACPWTAALAEIRDRLQGLVGVRFNSVLCNLYRDGGDSMGWHADNEPELGLNPTIASVSLGNARRFLLKSRRGDERLEFQLGHGSLLVMAGDCQHHWVHQVPKTARAVGTRINLTFRTVFPRSDQGHRSDR